MDGLFITLEGPEGSGKSTHAARLAERVRAMGRDVVCTREPGGTRVGEAIRGILQYDTAGEGPVEEAEVLLFAASRAQLVRTFIQPALAQGKVVICDRFMDSTTVYQGYGRGLDVEEMIRINAFAVGATVPDVTLVLDLDVEVGFARLDARNREAGTVRDRIESEAFSFHRRVRDGYLLLAGRWPERFCVIDADRPDTEVADAVWEALCTRRSELRGEA